MSRNQSKQQGPGGVTTTMEGVEVVSKEEIEEILKKVDKEASARKLTGASHWIVYLIGVSWSIFQVYTAAFGLFPAQLQRSIHLGYAFVLTFLLFPASSRDSSNRLTWFDWVLVAFAGYIGLYMALNYVRIMEAGGDYSRFDYLAAICGILLTLEAARRVVGLPIVCLAAFFIVYTYFGPYFPGFMAHRGYSLQRIASHMYLTTEGILGIPLGVAATFIYLFILFGSFREKSGLGQLFIDISNAVAGWASGGPAKMAIVTSALEGTVSGSSVANTVESGSLTIPMMKRLGYRPEFAAAVEASSSTGGQIMPPIMGAAAFIMAEFLNVPYLDIAKAAAIPACLYFFGVFMEVHFEAKRCNLRGLSRDELPKFGDVMRERGHLFVPLFAIILFLSVGFTPLYAALMGLVTCIIAGALKKATRMSFRQIADGFELGARNAIGVGLACASAGIIIGAITLTGLGLKLGNGLVELAGGNLLITLIFT
ncbi:MAG: transporter, fusion protein, partial [Deltaproteobacteria bacterium]|nr:transporter, fusion protein [Deltaproteobacteria bacterium]